MKTDVSGSTSSLAKIVAIVDRKNEKKTKDDNRLGEYVIKVQIYKADGSLVPTSTEPKERTQVTMIAPNNLYGESVTKEIDGMSNRESQDFHAAFAFAPKRKVPSTLKFISGDIQTELKISIK